MKENRLKKGISLIVLVITIVVIVILSVAVILSIANNNPIENAREATFKNDLKTIQEELELVKLDNFANNSIDYDFSNIKIENLNSASSYKDKLTIVDGELRFIDEQLNETEKEWAQEIGIKSSKNFISVFGGNSNYFISDETCLVSITADGNTQETFKIIKNRETGKYLKYGITENGLFANFDNYYEVVSEVSCEEDYSNLQYIEIPKEVKEIGRYAFSYIEVEEVKLPEGIVKLDECAFGWSEKLKKINLPNSLQDIDSALSGCSSLEAITIPENVKTIGGFMGCLNLKKVEIKGQNLEEIQAGAFDTTIISEIFIPKSVKTIGSYALSSCSINKIIVENGSALNLSEENIKSWGVQEVISIDNSSANTVITVKPLE